MTRRSLLGTAGLFALLALVSAPYFPGLALWPHSRDAAVWILRGRLAEGDWLEWVWSSQHFVAYRPVAALSYVVNDALRRGPLAESVGSYRATDLLLHVLTALSVCALYRALAPARPAWGGWLAAVLFASHPLGAEIVPHLARRSYALATVFGVAALVVLARAARASGARRLAPRVAGASALLAASFASNEVAFATAPAALLVAWYAAPKEAGRWRAVAATGTGTAIAAAVVLGARVLVGGKLGAYGSVAGPGDRIPAILDSSAAALGACAALPPGAWFAAAGVGLYYACFGLLWSLWRRRAPGVPFAWTAICVLSIAALGIWFPRVLYPAVAPLALGLAALVVETVRGELGTGWRRCVHLAPQLLLLGWLASQSPALAGLDPARVEAVSRHDAMLRELHDALEGVDEGSAVALVLPYFVRPAVHSVGRPPRAGRPPLGARQPETWVGGLLAERELVIETPLVFLVEGGTASADGSSSGQSLRPTIRTGPTELTCRIPAGIESHALRPTSAHTREPEADELSFRLSAGDGERWIYFHDGATGYLVRSSP